jgi:putative colanic acid biosynthesis UDP-glucose lipid carrier transferase
MGRVHTITTASARSAVRTSRLEPVRRAVNLLAGTVLLLLALPLLGVLALAVRRSSHGPVLHREPSFDRRGRPVELLSFRAAVDGASTTHHERLRAVVGAGESAALTGVGRLMRTTRTERLPRLLNVVRGQSSLF